MRIVQLTPGTGNFHCGNCMRDNALVNTLKTMGHDVLMVPMYLPHVVDETEAGQDTPIVFGGLNVYLQQKSGLFRYTPAWFDRLLNARMLLRKTADFAGMTSAKDLGQITVSMLQGENGKQNKEIDKLITFLKEQGGADVIVLSNCLLMGLAKRLRDELSAVVVCTLAGEDAFLDTLIEPYQTQAWSLLKEAAQNAAAFIPVSHYYANVMTDRLNLPPERVKAIYNGIDLEGFGPIFNADSSSHPPAIGYLARLCHGKGLHTLVDAFILMKQNNANPTLRLRIAGAATPEDKPYIAAQKQKLAAASLTDQTDFLTNITHQQKQDFLRTLTALSVPATYGEAFGLYLLEAWASEIPVVQPNCAAFPELIEATSAGLLCKPDDPADLAAQLNTLIADPEAAHAMGTAGRAAVHKNFAVQHMATNVINVYQQALDESNTPSRKAPNAT